MITQLLSSMTEEERANIDDYCSTGEDQACENEAYILIDSRPYCQTCSIAYGEALADVERMPDRLIDIPMSPSNYKREDIERGILHMMQRHMIRQHKTRLNRALRLEESDYASEIVAQVVQQVLDCETLQDMSDHLEKYTRMSLGEWFATMPTTDYNND